MTEQERWTEEDQAALSGLANQWAGETIYFYEADMRACKRAARILAHMIGVPVPPGEGDGR